MSHDFFRAFIGTLPGNFPGSRPDAARTFQRIYRRTAASHAAYYPADIEEFASAEEQENQKQ